VPDAKAVPRTIQAAMQGVESAFEFLPNNSLKPST
jgi:hypothetical protein